MLFHSLYRVWKMPITMEQEARSFSCHQCPMEYRQRRSLARHLRVDHGPRLRAWCLQCTFSSSRKDNLKRHYKERHPDRIGEVEGILLETEGERAQRQEGTTRTRSLEPPCKQARRAAVRHDLGDAAD